MLTFFFRGIDDVAGDSSSEHSIISDATNSEHESRSSSDSSSDDTNSESGSDSENLYTEIFGYSSDSSDSEVSSDTASSHSSPSETENGVPVPKPYVTIKRNICIGFKPEKEQLSESCHCFYLPDVADMACGTNCMNRFGLEECEPSVCPCGEYCQNQRFQKCQYSDLQLFYTKTKGFGIKAKKLISEGDFVIEYVGEMIQQKEFTKRMNNAERQKNFYIITIGGGKYVDATFKGNLGRFINHSCNPNCKPEIWQVRGQKCVGIFAIRDIQAGEEVTFDYRFERMGTTKQKCYCGEPNCRGYLGAKAPVKEKPQQKSNPKKPRKKPGPKPKVKANPSSLPPSKKLSTSKSKPIPPKLKAKTKSKASSAAPKQKSVSKAQSNHKNKVNTKSKTSSTSNSTQKMRKKTKGDDKH